MVETVDISRSSVDYRATTVAGEALKELAQGVLGGGDSLVMYVGSS